MIDRQFAWHSVKESYSLLIACDEYFDLCL